MTDAQSDYDAILALDRAHVIHPIKEFSKHGAEGGVNVLKALWPEAQRRILAEGT